MALEEYEARVGDRIEVASHRLRGSRRAGTILQVMGDPGHEYYRVRWDDRGESVLHPGPDATLLPATPRPRRRAARMAAAPVPPRPAHTAPPPTRPRAPALRAAPGDRLVIRGHHLGEPDRDAEILETLGENGGPPFRVRWSDTGREGLLFPGTDAVVDHIARKRRRARASA